MKSSQAVVLLKIRDIQTEIEYDTSTCGSNCLLSNPENFLHAIPEGLGKSGQTTHGLQLIFLTKDRTIIKRRKYQTNEQTAGFGLSYNFDRDKQRRAFEVIKKHKLSCICLPLQECSCSYEMQHVEGKTVSLHSSLYAPLLAQKYEVEYLKDRTEAISFLKNAWRSLTQLHQLGIQHGDPTHYNFIVNDNRFTLIDLDDTMQIEGKFSSWDYSIFLLYSFLPTVNEFFPSDSIPEIFTQVFGVEFQLSPAALAEFTALAKLPVSQFHELSRYRAQAEINKQAQNIAFDDLSRRFENLQSLISPQTSRIAQLESEVKVFQTAAEERLAVINSQVEAIAAMRQQIVLLEDQHTKLSVLRPQVLEFENKTDASGERPTVIYSHIEAIQTLHAAAAEFTKELETTRNLFSNTAQVHESELANQPFHISHQTSKQSDKITQLESELANLKVELQSANSLREAYCRTIEEQTRALQLQQEAHSTAYENASLVAEARLRVINEQQQLIESYQRWRAKERLKKLIKPQLGVLFQYNPKPIELPLSYKRTSPPKQALSISIVTPSFNQGSFIERTIQSVLSQDYPNLEYIIQDGASNDQTMEIVNKYSHKMKHHESAKDNGQTHALNLGFKHATGEIMAYLNSDDLLLPGALNYVANFFLRHPEIDVVYGHRVIIDEYDQEVGRWVMPPHDNDVLSWADYIPQETLFWRRSIWDKAGGSMDESFRFAMDWDLILRLRDAGARMRRLPRFLGAFRTHPHQKTSAQIIEIGNQEMARLRERCAGRPVAESEAWLKVRPYLKRHMMYRLFQRLRPFQITARIN